MATSFPLTHCTRCGGGGHYSWNAMTGSTCFGCNGSGRKHITKAGAEASNALAKMAEDFKFRPAAEIVVGDEVWVEGERIAERKAGTGRWERVVSAAPTERWSSKSTIGTGESAVTTVWYYIAIATETTTGEYGNKLRRRMTAADALHAAARVEAYRAAWKLTKAQRAKLANPEAEAEALAFIAEHEASVAPAPAVVAPVAPAVLTAAAYAPGSLFARLLS